MLFVTPLVAVATLSGFAYGRLDRAFAPRGSAAVTIHVTDPKQLPAPNGGDHGPPPQPSPATAAMQGLRGAVRGGAMSVTPGQVHVSLTRAGDGSHYRGVLPAVRVVDARGTLVGWHAQLRVVTVDGTDVANTRVRSLPDAPAVIDGQHAGLHAARSTDLHAGATVDLCHATPGYGGGTYRCGAHIDVALRHRNAGVNHLALVVALDVC
jgi:hypothetical protein